MQNISKRELIMEELSQVNGGYRIAIQSVNKGDCFTDTVGRYYARGNYYDVQASTWIEFDYFSTTGLYKGIIKKQVSILERSLTYDKSLSDRNYQPR